MPYWTHEQETMLADMVEQGKSLEEICAHFHRSPEAIRLKIKRLGLKAPSVWREKASDKVTTNATTTPLESIKPTEDLISEEEALKMWLGCVKRLNDPGISATELKRIRLILTALKSYIIVCSDYYLRMRKLEEDMEQLRQTMVDYLTVELNRSTSEEEREKWQSQIEELHAMRERELKELEKPYTIWPRIMRTHEPVFMKRHGTRSGR